MSLPYGPPVRVSPLIRGLRFSLLLMGIIYGRLKQRINKSREAAWQELEAERRAIRNKQLAVIRARIDKEEKENIRLLETGELFE